MKEITDIRDLYALKYQASEEGLELKDYLAKLRIHDIPLDVAMENAKKGISSGSYITKREKSRKLKLLARKGLEAALIVGLLGTTMIVPR